MILFQVSKASWVLVLILFLSSCVSKKEIIYFQGLAAQEQSNINQHESVEIKPNDLLTISVSAPEQAAAMPFNLAVIGMPQSEGLTEDLTVQGRQQLQTYQVSKEGNIEFPVLGNIEVEGFTTQKLSTMLAEQIKEYVQNPIVNSRIVNFQVSVLGEVARPGTYDVRDEYLSLPKALGFAGDLTIYGKRTNVLVMREAHGKKIYEYLDLTDPEVIISPFYYLQQNDVVYVAPNSAQIQSSKYNRNAGVFISIASILVSLAVLITK